MRKVLVTTGCALALIGANVSPASATTQDWDWCDSNQICLYDGFSGANHIVSYQNNYCNELTNYGLSGYGDRVSSAWNRTGHSISFFNWNARSQHFDLVDGMAAGARRDLLDGANNITDAVKMNC
ncbi:peptidase inhibitor family I36 protein [Amycolatopsis vastitatis]|uniref:peptidase inhibitor family I36 protein n=1 Tax=Amycolatopsis vastitatis TaxID=1905142 RepID=UPI00130423A9|nr:peptidase inhibitor family I36 protein [Amycolatopsis vastitatis]